MQPIVPSPEPTPWRLTPARAARIRAGLAYAMKHPRNGYSDRKARSLDPLAYKAALRYWENGHRARARRGLPPAGPSGISAPPPVGRVCWDDHAVPGSRLQMVIPHIHPVPAAGPIQPPSSRPRS